VNRGLRRFVSRPTGEAPPAGKAAAPWPVAAPAGGAAPAAKPASGGPATLATLAAGAAPADGPGQAPEETCEFCAARIPAEHGHVADLQSSSLMCACRPCYLLFTHSGAGQGWQQEPQPGEDRLPGQARDPGQAGDPGRARDPGQARDQGQARQIGRARYRAVPDRYRTDSGHPLTVAEWDALEIPVGLAFFLHSSASGETTAFYPSPAGVTECRLDLEAWARIAAGHPLLSAAAADVEAILISRGRPGQDGVVTFLVPIDACYELAGRMRLLWRGFDGGTEARDAVASFLERVRERAVDLGREP
jgi:hypothetical protein